jgi:hypothetical protein
VVSNAYQVNNWGVQGVREIEVEVYQHMLALKSMNTPLSALDYFALVAPVSGKRHAIVFPSLISGVHVLPFVVDVPIVGFAYDEWQCHPLPRKSRSPGLPPLYP